MTFEEFKSEVLCLDLPYGFRQTRSSYQAIATKDVDSGLVGVAWEYDCLTGIWTVDIVELNDDGERVLTQGRGFTPKGAFAEKMEVY